MLLCIYYRKIPFNHFNLNNYLIIHQSAQDPLRLHLFLETKQDKELNTLEIQALSLIKIGL